MLLSVLHSGRRNFVGLELSALHLQALSAVIHTPPRARENQLLLSVPGGRICSAPPIH